MILITGGAGFIGSNLFAALSDRGGKRLVICDVLDNHDKWKNVAKHCFFDFVTPDQLFDFLMTYETDMEAIFHMGAISSTTERDGNLFLENNIRLSLDLFHWCGDHRVRYIYASSAATYGDGQQGFDDTFTARALAKLRPLNPYGWSKNAVDRAVALMHEDSASDIPLPPQYVGLKFFNVYGPNEYHKGTQMSVVPGFVKQILETGQVNLFKSEHPNYEDGGQMRDFIAVDDCVSIMLWLLDASDVSGIFNVGTGKARRFDTLAKAVFTALNTPVNIQFIEMPEGLKTQYQYFTEAKMENLRTAGYEKAFLSLEEGVKRYVQDYLLKEDSYR